MRWPTRSLHIAVFTLCILPDVIPKGYPAENYQLNRHHWTPADFIVEAKELVAPARSPCLDTMMRTARGKGHQMVIDRKLCLKQNCWNWVRNSVLLWYNIYGRTGSPFNDWHSDIDLMMHKLEAMEITIIMPNDPMVWIGIYWSAALLQHIFLKCVTCQAHFHHAKLFSSSVNGTRNLQYRGHMRPAFMALPDYFILYSRLKLIVMECPVKSRWPIP